MRQLSYPLRLNLEQKRTEDILKILEKFRKNEDFYRMYKTILMVINCLQKVIYHVENSKLVRLSLQ